MLNTKPGDNGQHVANSVEGARGRERGLVPPTRFLVAEAARKKRLVTPKHVLIPVSIKYMLGPLFWFG